MRALFKENLIEALIGLFVVLLSAWFVMFAYQRTGGGLRGNSYSVSALFGNISGVTVGTDVRVAGMKVGSVTGTTLDPESYQAKLTLSIYDRVKMPADSSAAITSEGILGGTYVALLPGGDPAPLKQGDVIVDTQGAMDLMALIGQYINQSGGAGSAGTAPGGPDGAVPSAP